MEIDKLSIGLEGSSKQAVSAVDALISTLSGLQSSMAGLSRPSGTLVKNIDKVSTSLVNLANAGNALANVSHGISAVAESLVSLQSFGTSATGIKAATSALNSLNNSLSKTQSATALQTTAVQLSSVAETLKSVSNVSASISDFVKSLNSLNRAVPKLVTSLPLLSSALGTFISTVNALPAVNANMLQTVNALAVFGKNSKALPQSIRATTQAFRAYNSTANTTRVKTNSLMSAMFNLQKTVAAIAVAKQAMDKLATSVKASVDYVENVNLFSVALGDMTSKGWDLANAMNAAFSTDSSETTRMMGMFYQMSESLGLTSDNAFTLSESFTKLTNDLSSLFNISRDEAFTKLRAGLAGESEPLRRLGIITTENALAETALALGIDKSVRSMTEAEKIHLRYITIMQQSVNAHGDFARQIGTAAVQSKMLADNMSQLSRAIGNMFMPMITQALPYVNAFVMVLTQLFNKFAAWFGYEFDESDGVESLAYDVLPDTEDALTDVGKAVDKVKSKLLGIDQLNILPDDSASNTSAVSGTVTSDITSLLPLEGYDNLMSTVSDKTKKLAEQFSKWFDMLLDNPVETFSQLVWGLAGKIGGLTSNLFKLSPKATEALAFALTTLTGALAISAIGVPLPLAVALSALVNSGIINLLGKNAGIKALGVGISGIGTALLVYKATSNPLISAISGLGVALLQGGLLGATGKIEALTPALTGLGTSFLIFSKLKKNPAFSNMVSETGALAKVNRGGLTAIVGGLSAFAFAMAEIIGNENAFSAVLDSIGGALAGVGVALFVGTGPVGMLIGAAIGLIAGAIKGVAEYNNAVKAKQWGELSLSIEDVQEVIGELVGKYSTAIDGINTKSEELKKSKAEVDRLRATTDKDIELFLKIEAPTQKDFESMVQSVKDLAIGVQEQVGKQKEFWIELEYGFKAIGTSGLTTEQQILMDTMGNATRDVEQYVGGIITEIDKISSEFAEVGTKKYYEQLDRIKELQAMIDEIAKPKVTDNEKQAVNVKNTFENLKALGYDKESYKKFFEEFKTQLKTSTDGLDETIADTYEEIVTATKNGIIAVNTQLENPNLSGPEKDVLEENLKGYKEALGESINGVYQGAFNTAKATIQTEKDEIGRIYSDTFTDLIENMLENANKDSKTLQKEFAKNLEEGYSFEDAYEKMLDSHQKKSGDVTKQIESFIEDMRESGLEIPAKFKEGVDAASYLAKDSLEDYLKNLEKPLDENTPTIKNKIERLTELMTTMPIEEIDSKVLEANGISQYFAEMLADGYITGFDSKQMEVIESAYNLNSETFSNLKPSDSDLMYIDKKTRQAILSMKVKQSEIAAGAQSANGYRGTIVAGISATQKNISDVKSLWQTLISGPEKAIAQSKEPAVSTSKGFLKDLLGAITPSVNQSDSLFSSFKGIGEQSQKGYEEGIQTDKKGFLERIGSFFGSVTTTVKSIFDQHSPSRVFAEIGRFVDEGFIQGIESLSGRVQTAAEGVFDLSDTVTAPDLSNYQVAMPNIPQGYNARMPSNYRGVDYSNDNAMNEIMSSVILATSNSGGSGEIGDVYVYVGNEQLDARIQRINRRNSVRTNK